jgi:hypothetical protein
MPRSRHIRLDCRADADEMLITAPPVVTIRHALRCLLCTEDGADRVDREDPPYPLEFEILQPGLWRKDRGVVHQHIDPAEVPVDRGE